MSQQIATAKVIGYTNNSVFHAINTFLQKKGNNSKNTLDSYTRHYKEFFDYLFNKPMEQLEWKDIDHIPSLRLDEYHQYILTKNAKNGKLTESQKNTVNVKVAAIKCLFKYLAEVRADMKEFDARGNLITIHMAGIQNMDTYKLSNKRVEWGALKEKEYYKLLEFCSYQSYRPYAQKMYFELAIITASRKEALLDIKWKDIFKTDDEDIEVWVIAVLDKRNDYYEVPISEEFHQALMDYRQKLTIDGIPAGEDNKIIPVSEDTLADTLDRFCKAEKIPEKRNIVLHSLKKTSMDMVYARTKDVALTAEHGHHESLEMLYERYCNQNRRKVDMPSYNLFHCKPQTEKLQEATKEQLINAILKCSPSVQMEIIHLLEQK